MSEQRERAREQLPQVLLGVLGILQALALELLWEQGVGGLDRWRAIDALGAGILQVACVFLGVVVVWLMYASLVMRFSWVPRFQDLIVPFVLGVLEFGLIGLMGPEHVAAFFGLLAVVFVTSAGTNFGIYRAIMTDRSRQEMRMGRAGYGPAAVTTLLLLPSAALAAYFGPGSWVTLGCLLLANGGLIAQIRVFGGFWRETVDRLAG